MSNQRKTLLVRKLFVAYHHVLFVDPDLTDFPTTGDVSFTSMVVALTGIDQIREREKKIKLQDKSTMPLVQLDRRRCISRSEYGLFEETQFHNFLDCTVVRLR